MKSKVFFGFSAGALGMVGLALGCGGSNAGSGGGQQGGGGSISSTGTLPPVGSSSSTGGMGMGGGAGNHSFDTAANITVGAMATAGTLADPTTQNDFYQFTGKAGDKIGIYGIAQTAASVTHAFDATYLDLVVTLYDQNQKPIAMQDDPWPRGSNDPQLFTVLPTAGTYYVEVQDCNSAFGSMNCNPASGIKNKDYQIEVFDVGGTGVVDEPAEPNDTPPATPAPFTYARDMTTGKYTLMLLDGGFSSKSDVDVYPFKPPADVSMNPGSRAHAEFWIATSGVKGNGATSPVGEVWVERADTPGVMIGSLDNTKYGDVDNATNGPAFLSVPLSDAAGAPDGKTTFFLFVKHPYSAAGSNDFYYLEHFVEGTSLVETEPNDSVTTPQDLTTDMQTNSDGSVSHYIDGNLTLAGNVDVADYFSVPVGSMKTITVSCGSLRDGSGLQGFTITLYSGKTHAKIGTAAVEVANQDLFISKQDVSKESTVIIGLTATSQDATNTGTYYECGFHLNP